MFFPLIVMNIFWVSLIAFGFIPFCCKLHSKTMAHIITLLTAHNNAKFLLQSPRQKFTLILL